METEFIRIAAINFLIKIIFKHKMYYTTSKNAVFGRKLQGKLKFPREAIFPILSAWEFGSGHIIPGGT